MPHTPGHNTAQYKIYGTDEPYSGMTVEIGGFMYSTVGGALEGNSMQLVANTPMNANPDMNQNNNPVTRTFVSRVTYYRQDGTPVAPGVDLHQHADGTIMLGHDPENMGEIVTRTQPIMGGSTGTNAQEMGELGNMGAGGGISPSIGNQGGGMSGGNTGGGGY